MPKLGASTLHVILPYICEKSNLMMLVREVSETWSHVQKLIKPILPFLSCPIEYDSNADGYRCWRDEETRLRRKAKGHVEVEAIPS